MIKFEKASKEYIKNLKEGDLVTSVTESYFGEITRIKCHKIKTITKKKKLIKTEDGLEFEANGETKYYSGRINLCKIVEDTKENNEKIKSIKKLFYVINNINSETIRKLDTKQIEDIYNILTKKNLLTK